MLGSSIQMTGTWVGMDVTARSVLIINPLSPGSLCKWLAWVSSEHESQGTVRFFTQQQFLLEEEFRSSNVICKALLVLASEIVAEYCPCQPVGEEWSTMRVTVQRCEHGRLFRCGKIFGASRSCHCAFLDIFQFSLINYLLWVLFWYDLKWIFMHSSPRVCPTQYKSAC